MGGHGPLLVLLLSAALALPASSPPAAEASFHLMKVREVYPGTSNDSYVVLQMLLTNESALGNHSLRLYNASGGTIETFTFSLGYVAPKASHGNNTVLIGDTGVQTTFGIAPDDHTDADFNVPAAGGAVCWLDGSPPDCVAWGNFSGSLPNPAGSPVSPGGVTAGKALRRSISPGCSTYLDSTDDSNNSATDFAEVDPLPRNNATEPTETVCPALPNTTIGTKPADPTKSTGASFSFTASPATGASFECKLDLEPSFTACTSPETYAALSEGTHAFEVRAVNSAGADPTPARHEWKVDLTPPEATILNKPPNPSPGKNVSFTYESNELGPLSGSPFECRLVPLEVVFTTCAAIGKTYLNLAEGEYTFEVLATDRAGNKGGSDSYTWTVEVGAADITPPQTTIGSKPSNPSTSSTASFTYSSDEPESTFECMLDGGGFAPCPTAGITYTGLGNGAHTFQVRAIDSSSNVDPIPAGYSFDVVLTSSPPAPPGPATPSVSTKAPDTTISGKPGAKTRDRTPSFRFRSSQPAASFECKLDRKPFKPCRSPLTTKTLSYGRHTLLVRTVLAGVSDTSPAKFTFKVVKP